MEPNLDEKKSIIREMVKKLPNKQRRATIQRFWENKSIFEIAKSLRISWCEADDLINTSIKELKKEIQDHPRLRHALKSSSF